MSCFLSLPEPTSACGPPLPSQGHTELLSAVEHVDQELFPRSSRSNVDYGCHRPSALTAGGDRLSLEARSQPEVEAFCSF